VVRILLVDDEPTIRLSLGDALRSAGHVVSTAADGAEAIQALRRELPDLVLCDVRLPKVDGMTLFREVRGRWPGVPVLLMTAYAAVSEAVAALKEGAADYVTKPFGVDDILARIDRLFVQDRADATDENDPGHWALLGESGAIHRLRKQIRAYAQSDAPVLITGEAGTGKGLVAKLLHDRSPRSRGPFRGIDCRSSPELGTPIAWKLGRRNDASARVREAGSLLLDEIGELATDRQHALLGVLDSNSELRPISTTHRDLEQGVSTGRFLEDLYHRLSVLELELPPLRARRADLPMLVEGLLDRSSPRPEISKGAMDALAAYPFPGNLRQLEQILKRAAAMSNEMPIEEHHLPSEVLGLARVEHEQLRPSSGVHRISDAAEAFEREDLIRALDSAGGERREAAKLLGISLGAFDERARRLGISDRLGFIRDG
jgi:DNA-binding NtrC family response regulator